MTSVNHLNVEMSRTSHAIREVTPHLNHLLTQMSALAACLPNESDLLEGDRQHAAKWRLLCKSLGVEPTCTHRTLVAHLKPLPGSTP